jgi:twitching motility two-component system response regulator PilG
MKSLLVIDDDDAMRRLIRLSLMDSHQIFDTGDPEQVLALALEHEPDGILLDLRMPRYSGFELCQTFTSLSSTQLIPVIVVSGEAGARTKELCRDLGAAAYFEKPVNFDALRNQLADLLRNRRSERRLEARVRLRVPLKLVGRTQSNEPFRILTATENASSGSFLWACGIVLSEGALVEVYLATSTDEHVGQAQVIRSEWNETQYRRYAFRFTRKSGSWALQ